MAKTLLLADDSVTIQKVVNISFASEDVTLVTVDNGDDALERAKETRPDLILADVVMPGKNGYEVCEAIKADPDLAHIPVLLLTGTFEAFDEERASRAGAAGHVAKPFEAQTLVNQVNRLLAEAPPPVAAREPAPVAPPEAVTAPTTGDAEKGESFDFFDDDLVDLAAPEAAAAESDSVSFEDSDSAFAFGDEDLTPAAPEPVREETGPPPSPPQDFGAAFDEQPVPDRTVAILPDDTGPAEALPAEPVPAPPAEVSPTALSADFDDSGFGDAGDEMIAVPEREPEDSFALVDPSAASDEAFDFTFDSEPVAAEPALGDGLMNVEAEDLVQATVLDPDGAAGYDVSSSDLGDPFAAEPIEEAPEPADATRLMDFPAVMDEPMAAAELTGVGDFGEELAPAVFEPEEQPAAPAHEFEPPAAAEPAFELPAAALPAEAVRSFPDEPAVRADSVLSEIAPTLRAEIHDTLEKVAWESFGDVTEKIVADAIDRVEKIAWEVIPQLAETLIKEEIRRLKGESDD
jgi:CheY-like chemotaxis protein